MAAAAQVRRRLGCRRRRGSADGLRPRLGRARGQRLPACAVFPSASHLPPLEARGSVDVAREAWFCGSGAAIRRRRVHIGGACLERLVSGARDDEPGCEHGRDLERRCRFRHRLRLLSLRLRGTRRATREAGPRPDDPGRPVGRAGAARGSRSPCIRAGGLGALLVQRSRACASGGRERVCSASSAGEAALELLAESAAGAEHQGLDRGDRDVEHVGDLGVGAAFELAHDEGGALVEGEEAEGAADLGRGRDVGVLGRRGASESSNSTSRGRRDESRKRCRQTLCAILISQLCGVRGRSPRWNARYALRKVVWVTSSASASLWRTARA